MTSHLLSLPSLPGLPVLVAVLTLAATPVTANEAPAVSKETLDHIQRVCLRTYPPAMLAKMAASSQGGIPAEVDASPASQNDFLTATLEGDKGPFYPILLEELYPPLAAYLDGEKRFLDLGSGDGRVVFLAALLGADAHGIEYEKDLVEISEKARQELGELLEGRRIHIRQGDFFAESWSGYDVIYYFDISSFEHHRLRKKLVRELDAGAHLLVGHEQAAFPGLALETTFGPIHVYRQPEAVMKSRTLVQRCKQEVVELHQFFQDWFNGTLPEGDESFRRFNDVMAPGFQIVTPEGRTVELPVLADGLRRAYGKWRVTEGEAGKGKIWVRDIRSQVAEGVLALVTYQEWQEFGGERRGRQSSAFFRLHHGTPNGVIWMHVHETWLPSQEP